MEKTDLMYQDESGDYWVNCGSKPEVAMNVIKAQMGENQPITHKKSAYMFDIYVKGIEYSLLKDKLPFVLKWVRIEKLNLLSNEWIPIKHTLLKYHLITVPIHATDKEGRIFSGDREKYILCFKTKQEA